MPSTIIILGKTIPLYGLLFYIGVAFAVGVAFILRRFKNRRGSTVEPFDLAGAGVYAMIGALIGAKLLFLLLSWKDIIRLGIGIEQVIKGGFVFYGGLIGGILGLIIFGIQFKMSILPIAELAATVVPLGHAFGRIGCFFGGCCYGMPYDGFPSVTYHSTMGKTPLETPLLAIQLIEAAGLLILFGIMLVIFFKAKESWTVILSYVSMYALLRFALEFFRGDRERGSFLSFSTSQWIAVIMLIAAVCILLYRRSKTKAKE